MRHGAGIVAGTTCAVVAVLGVGAWAGISRVGEVPGLTLVSTALGETTMSGDGRHIASVVPQGVVVKDLRTGEVTSVCQVTDYCSEPSLSHDARFVAFSSNAALAPGDRPKKRDIFVKDLQTGEVRALVGGPGYGRERGAQTPSISADGRRVAFVTGYGGSPKQRVWVADETGKATSIGDRAAGPRISADGNTVVFYTRTNERTDALERGNWYGSTGMSAPDSMRRVTIKDLRTGRLSTLADRADLVVHTKDRYSVDYSSPSADGTRLAVNVRSTTEEAGLYVVDLRTGRVLYRVHTRAGRPAETGPPQLSADGDHLMFASTDDLVAGDRSRGRDVFVTDLRSGETRLVSAPQDLNSMGFDDAIGTRAGVVAISADGTGALFGSTNAQQTSAKPPARSAGVYLGRVVEAH